MLTPTNVGVYKQAHTDKCQRLQVYLKFPLVLVCSICNNIEPVSWKYGKMECRFYLPHQKLFSKYLFPLFQFSIIPLYPYTFIPIFHFSIPLIILQNSANLTGKYYLITDIISKTTNYFSCICHRNAIL